MRDEEMEVLANIRELREWLEANGCYESTMMDIVEHEGAHVEEGLHRGYQYVSRAGIETDEKGRRVFYAATSWLGRVTDGDALAILLAPENPSREDLRMAEEIRGRLAA